jgi:hypothetical protein
MAGKIQGADVKTEAELISAGATASSLIRDTQIYISANSINKTLDDAIIDGDVSGGSGGGSMKWIEGVPSANTIKEADVEVHTFSLADAGSQFLYAMVRVPTTYQAGKQIRCRIPVYSIDSSGTFLIQSVARLIRTGTDTFSTTANTRTSTNTAITASGANQNKPQAVILDLTSTIGEINAVAVSAGDYIIVRLQRGTDTATSDVRALTYASEVTFR